MPPCPRCRRVECICEMTIKASQLFPRLLDEVHRSNMSKLVDGKPVVREDGKILKGPGFSPPDIAGCLKRQGWEG